MNILCVDAGSSSLKFAVYDASDEKARRVLRGAAEGLGQPSTRFWIEHAGTRTADDTSHVPLDSKGVLARVFETIAACGAGAPAAIGHRIVFGGPDHVTPALVLPELLVKLEGYVPFDPLHLRSQLDLVRAVAARIPAAPQVLCFDTAFHNQMPAVAQRIPLPRSVGPLIRRYGYHGLSFEYIISALGEGAAGRVLIAHLGSGASLAAVRDGKPIDTTMGFSPLGGLMMSTRPGDLDPGVLLYLVAIGTTGSDLEELLNLRSGLLGVSELSASMETLLTNARENKRAQEAIDVFVYQLRKHFGAMVAALGGLDTLVFTGGIGENAAKIRELATSGLTNFGINLDPAANEINADVISRAESPVTVRIIPTDETAIIARHVRTILKRAGTATRER